MTLPRPDTLIGLTHATDGTPIISEVKTMKVSIGVPKGRAWYVYKHQGRWIVRYGVWVEKDGKRKLEMATAKGSDGKMGFPDRAETEAWCNATKKTFAISDRPQKLPFFTFVRRQMVEENGKPVETFEPDFAAIEAHGDTPREIDVVFMSNEPLSGEYAAWSASALKCHGDGINALRSIEMGNDQWPGWKEARAANQKYFPVSECWMSGMCPYMADGGSNGLVCKPSATLTFQLANSIKLGATAYFTTTSFRSVKQLFSSLAIIRSVADRAGAHITNIPMKLVLAPFKTAHNGIVAQQYGVSLELRAQDSERLRKLLTESEWRPTTGTKMLAAPTEEEDVIELSAAEMSSEFYPDAEFEDAEVVESEQPKAATEKKTADLAEKLAAKRQSEPPKAEPPAPPIIEPSPEVKAAQEASSTEKDNPWPGRTYDTYAAVLGVEKFVKCLGGLTISQVNAENYGEIWDRMKAAKRKLDSEKAAPQTGTGAAPAPGGDGSLF